MTTDEKIQMYIELIRHREEFDLYTVEAQEPIYELEEEILEFYGLPLAGEISENLQAEVLINAYYQGALDHIKIYLQRVASDFLTTKPKTDRELLENGKAGKIRYDNVIHYMGILPHPYCVYIYEELYCTDKINTEEALTCINAFKNHFEINQLIDGVDKFETIINFNIYKRLCEANFPRLEEFIQFTIAHSAKHEVDLLCWKKISANCNGLPIDCTINHFFIKEIDYDHNLFSLNILTKYNERWEAILVFTYRDDFEKILSFCRFKTDAVSTKANIEIREIGNIDLNSYDFRQLEIVGVTVSLKSILDEDQEGHKEFNIISIDKYSEELNPDLPF